MKKYPKYKPSNVPWIGEVPSNWNISRIKHVATCNDEALSETIDPDTEIVYIDISSVNYLEGITNQAKMRFSEAPSRARRIVKEDDILISTVRTYLRAIVKISAKESSSIVSTGFAVVRPRKINPDYLAFVVQSENFILKVISESKGVSYPSITPEALMNIDIPIPSMEEQVSIANHLNIVMIKIDTAINKKRVLISVLQEELTAIINSAITKGINPKAKMKASGIEWIGETPSHWEVNKFSRIALYQEGPGLRNWQFTDEGIKVICVTNITEKGIDFSLLNRCISIDEYNSTYKHFTVNKGDYLLSSSGASWGKIAMYNDDEPVILNTSTIRFNTADPNLFDKQYIYWLMKSEMINEQLSLLLTGSCQPNFGPSHLSKLKIVYPKIEEQQQIVSFLECSTTKINTAINKIELEINLLQEYKTSLINEVVTGKISVLKNKIKRDTTKELVKE